jgi:hypothetical protein
MNVQSFKNPHKSTSTLTLTKANVIFQFGSPKRTTFKVHMNNAPSTTFKKNMFFRLKIEIKTKIATCKDL